MSKPIVFMFSGQGSQYYQMGRELYENHPRFQLWMDHCDDLLYPLIDASLVDIIYHDEQPKSALFDNIIYTNPALLSVEYCLARILMESGIKPDYLLGYSLGEFSAAVVSGAIELEQGLELVVAFARQLEATMAPAGMLAVIESPGLMTQYPQWFERCWLSGSNFDRNFVVSGLADDLNTLQQQLKAQNVMHQRLAVNYGFHTQLIDPLKNTFKQLMKSVELADMNIPIYSALTKSQLTELNNEYFWQVVRTPVNFEQTVQSMIQKQDYRFIDVGPSGTLATFVKYIQGDKGNSEGFELINQYGKNLRSLDNVLSEFGGVQ